jgi:hypothetical protein
LCESLCFSIRVPVAPVGLLAGLCARVAALASYCRMLHELSFPCLFRAQMLVSGSELNQGVQP